MYNDCKIEYCYTQCPFAQEGYLEDEFGNDLQMYRAQGKSRTMKMKNCYRERVQQDISRNNTELLSTITKETFQGYPIVDLTKAWLTMSNDMFHMVYGFNYIPPSWLQDKVREVLMVRNTVDTCVSHDLSTPFTHSISNDQKLNECIDEAAWDAIAKVLQINNANRLNRGIEYATEN